MKAVREDIFRPVTITLETQEELTTLFNLVNCNNSVIEKIMKEQYGKEWQKEVTMNMNIIENIYDAIKEI